MKDPKTTIQIVCIDDHPLVREGIARKIGRQHDMRIVGTASTGEEGVELFHRYRPDIVVMDLQLPGMKGLQAIELIREVDPDARIIVLTVCGGEEDIFRAIHAGAASYLMKETLSSDLISIIRRVYAGERPLPPRVAERMASRIGLSPREVDVIELIAGGKRNKEIADALGITQETVQTHIKKLFHKLGVNDRTAALTAALTRGIVHI